MGAVLQPTKGPGVQEGKNKQGAWGWEKEAIFKSHLFYMGR